MAELLETFDRQAAEHRVEYVSKADNRRRVIVTLRTILPVGAWQIAPAEEQAELPVVLAAALDDHQGLKMAKEKRDAERALEQRVVSGTTEAIQTGTQAVADDTPSRRSRKKADAPDDGLG